VHGGGQLTGEGDDLELVAVLAVPGPLSGEAQGLAALHAGQRADDSDLGVVRIVAKLRDGVVVFLVEEDDALEDAVE
jgi:hypothetical protein